MTAKKRTVEFHPGCFDDFEGSQEELEELKQAIINTLSDPENDVDTIPLEEYIEDLPEGEQQYLVEKLVMALDEKKRNLQ